ncbi:hypothetical protein P2G88_12145 [Aliiglaciecola sp. CAU 1673]|uniref:hypothetical protein n=1 Tax=Aliiglaciecola sp. CAU 1673 TaxID=3032595 RepID=UPI0023DB59F1|nr:hypothetical protein [Aliiglaciecola sp. CAU 1673]MDF2179002.1 hypothetical protein [Aliiglaciecola sp. CAU 1673]
MTVQSFINRKAKQLAFFVRAFWEQKIPYREMDLYFWDTMEEWNQLAARHDEPFSQKERVFWHLLHQVHFWPESHLREDPYLRTELTTCLEYLEGDGQYPLDCVGVRP